MFAAPTQRMAAMRQPIQSTTFHLQARPDAQSMVVHLAKSSARALPSIACGHPNKGAEPANIERFISMDYDLAPVESGS